VALISSEITIKNFPDYATGALVALHSNFPKGFRARHFGVGGVGGKNGNE
jgi:hypothetical protein